MKKFVVYTAITGRYDTLHSPPALWREHADFVAFMDVPQLVEGWDIRPAYRRFKDPNRNAKIHKILSHKYFPDAEYSLWMDGAFQIKSALSLARWPEEYLREHDLAVMKHRSRNCAYREAAACIQLELDSFDVIKRQMEKYLKEGYPSNNGLAECGILFRRHTKLVKRFNEAWYAEIKKHSRRDQLSFNYAAHKVGLKYNLLPGGISRNQHFFLRSHGQTPAQRGKN